MAKKQHVSETPATQLLRANKIAFTEHPYEYLEHGGALMVTQQNLETSHDEARDLRGQQVRVGWRERQTVAIAGKNPEEGSD